MKRRIAVLMLPAALYVGACADGPVEPVGLNAEGTAPSLQRARPQAKGTGLVLESVTGLPIVGDLVVQEAFLTDLALVEDVASGLIQLQATGLVDVGTSVLGATLATEEFTASVGVVNSGGGQCEIVRIDPAPMTIDVLGQAVAVDLPVSEVDVRGGGAVGQLVCLASGLLGPVTGGVSRALQSLVNAINNLLP